MVFFISFITKIKIKNISLLIWNLHWVRFRNGPSGHNLGPPREWETSAPPSASHSPSHVHTTSRIILFFFNYFVFYFSCDARKWLIYCLPVYRTLHMPPLCSHQPSIFRNLKKFNQTISAWIQARLHCGVSSSNTHGSKRLDVGSSRFGLHLVCQPVSAEFIPLSYRLNGFIII